MKDDFQRVTMKLVVTLLCSKAKFMVIHYKCETKNIEWIKDKFKGKISWLALKLWTFLSSIVVT